MEDKKWTSDEILEIIKNKMENEERYRLLSLLYDEYYNKSKIKIADLEYDDEYFLDSALHSDFV